MRSGTAARRARLPWSWFGLVPFFGYVSVFFLLPTAVIAYSAFRVRGEGGASTFGVANMSAALGGAYLDALWNSATMSLVCAVIAAVLGMVLAYAVATSRGGLLQKLVSTSAAVLANFGGLPLAFLFVAAIGNAGVLTVFVQEHLGLSLRDDLGLDLYSRGGVQFVYLYFLIPLMVLVITPAIEGLRPEWREAAEGLGARGWQYWRHVAGPALLPHFLGSIALLFCTAFSSYATAEALTNGTLAITPLRIDGALSGNVLAGQENLGAALALSMIVVVVPLTLLYQLMQRRSSRWLQ
ncbi:putative spermidine/putrescine transport system permease protein [Rhodococcus sp. OK611]|uniref:ABC transporter permease n=1 Tax=unclassified Rhodococcus (in: high G+C Gram-positive bacteria) TaxID=192944 RepID=UPI000BD53AFF|nr:MULTISPECIES: ABC transporter permease subunit [unclassified Rhodococcus (in: high G+C Gram-positive bacteria)]PTR44896.1 putative spermidine/putrescine transport system permease protein [Rhodococcus sp. OK611]SNX89231.1 putative spermidine/putrescine transport system permease protein [Rhodococcus sp. OK270]